MSALRTPIGWEEPRAPQKFSLLVCGESGHAREATDEDLQKAGYVKRANDSTIAIEVREALAWRAIDKWLRAKPDKRAATVTPANKGSKWYAVPMRCVDIDRAERELGSTESCSWPWHDTKVEALEALAKWCEAHP